MAPGKSQSLSHAGIPRTCPLCERKFYKLDHLQRHIRSHTKEKPFVCKICGKRYGRSDTLLRHSSAHRRPKDNEPSTTSQTTSQTTPPSTSSRDPLSDPPGILSPASIPRPLPSTSAAAYPDLEPSSTSSAIDSAHRQSSAPTTEHYIDPSLCAFDRNASLPPPISASFAPEVHPSLSENPAVAKEDFRNFNPHDQAMLETVGDECDLTLDQSPTLEHEQDSFAWANFDFGDLDWRFLGSSPLESSETQVRGALPFENSIGPRAEPAETVSNVDSTATVVERAWFTRLESSSGTKMDSSHNDESGTTSPRNGAAPCTEIDEVYRQSLSNRLRPQWSEKPLPSTDFLKLCVQMYFSRANQALPILHGPTFRPTSDNGSLLLSICSVGCLFLGTTEAAHYGSILFERLLKAMMASWDIIQARHKEQRVPMVQLALIGQTFGMLSGESRHLAIVSAFHGTVISWARRAEMFDIADDDLDLEGLSGPQLGEQWSKWARKEEIKRAALAIFIHDAEIAALFHHEPFLRHRRNYVPLACNSDIFLAPTVRSWARLMKEDMSAKSQLSRCDHLGAARPLLLTNHGPTASCCRSVFTGYAILEGIGASICEDKAEGRHDSTSRQTHQANLILWYQMYHERIKAESDSQCLMILWHWTCMANHVDLNRLELAIGKHGPLEASAHTAYVHGWSASPASNRCLMHAFLLQKAFEDMFPRRVVAIHVPRCLFSAAVAWATYLNSLSSFPPILPPGESLEFPELRQLGTNFTYQWNDVIGFKKENLCTIKGMTLCTLADMLRQMSYWDIARKFSRILAPLIHGATDDGMVQG